MHYFVDEGGLFTPETGWSVVCSLGLPHKELGPTRREIDRISRGWPRKDGELKGGLLQLSHLEALVEVLFRHDALLQACATDVSSHDRKDIDDHKANQCEGITKHLTSEHDANLVSEVWKLRHTLERISGISRRADDAVFRTASAP